MSLLMRSVFLDLVTGRHVSFCDGLYLGIEAKWSPGMPSRTDVNDVLPTNSVIRQTFNKSGVDEVTHLEITGVNLRLVNASGELLDVVRMSRKLTFFQGQHSGQVHWLMGYAIETLARRTHELEPVILYNFRQTMIILYSITFKEERYGVHLIDG